VLALLVVGLVAGGARRPALGAQEATPPAAAPGFVGSWRVVVSPAGGQPHLAGLTFTADGTVIAPEPPVQPAPPGFPFRLLFLSSGNGVWAATGATTGALTFDLIAADEHGTPLGAITVRGTMELSADGGSFAAAFAAVLTDPAGRAVPVGGGTFRGERMVVEPLGTPPAGTPTP
jgi:hypothetical protein